MSSPRGAAVLTGARHLARGLVSTGRLARCVREPIGFVARQARRRGGVARYRLRGSDVTVYLRHGSPDINTLEQIFRLRHYQPPAAVEDVLRDAGRALHVVDLGAHVGLFAAYVLQRFPDARVTAFEPDPANAELLAKLIAANGKAGSWRLVRACAAVEDGSVRFSAGRSTNSRVEPGSGDGTLVPAVDVFPSLADADLVKMDIEGSEWAILADPRFSSLPARAVSLEYHSHLCPAPDPRRLAVETLARAGFETADADFHAPAGHGLIWAWRAG